MRIPVAVKRGAALLDERLPGWRKRIDKERLDLGQCHSCVLGQVLGDYDDGLDLLGIHESDEVYFGFAASPRKSYDVLTREWLAVLDD